MRKHLLQYILIVSFLFLISPVTQAEGIKQEKPRLLVVPLKAQIGIQKEEAILLTDILSVEIYRSGMFTILNRDDMKAVLTEKEFESAMGCEDNVCLLQNVAKLAVNKLIAGNIGKLGKKYIISIRLINEDGHNEVMEKESCDCAIEELDKSIEKIAYKFLKYLGAETTTYSSIRIESEPSKAKIYIDGSHLDTTPNVIRYIEPGQHKVEIMLDGYKTWSKKVNVDTGEEEVLIAILQKKAGPIKRKNNSVSAEKYTDSSFIYSANNSKIFHRYNCPELNTKDLIEFNSSQVALNAGGIPCRSCNPSHTAKTRVKVTQQITRTTNPFFQNRFVRVTLQSISKSRDKRNANLTLILENISKKDILLAMKSSYGNSKPQASILDDKGVQWKLHGRDLNGIQLIYGSNASKKREKYSVFNPGTKNTITMAFKTREQSDGKTFSFSANFLKYISSSPTQFSIGISEMSLRK